MCAGYWCRSGTPGGAYHPFLGELRDRGLHGDRAKWMASGGRLSWVGRTRTGTKRGGLRTRPACHAAGPGAVALISATSAISASPVPIHGSGVVEGGGERRRDLTRRGSARSKARRRGGASHRISAPLIPRVPAPPFWQVWEAPRARRRVAAQGATGRLCGRAGE